MTESRSGLSSSASARATASMTVAGRNAPASSWAGVVRRASNSGAGRGVAGLEGGLGMILANVRGRLRVQDFLLVALALAHGDTARRARYERQLLEEGPDELLDEPGLLAALLALRTLMVPSPALFTYVAVRHTLRAAGVDDRALADYLAALLLEFGDHDRQDRKSTRLNSSHDQISYAVFCLKKKKKQTHSTSSSKTTSTTSELDRSYAITLSTLTDHDSMPLPSHVNIATHHGSTSRAPARRR